MYNILLVSSHYYNNWRYPEAVRPAFARISTGQTAGEMHFDWYTPLYRLGDVFIATLPKHCAQALHPNI